ncbi:MAG: prepilin-type N-terminal cleavage/methylation domain-containing protein [Candidatus Gribaldobacteria bacterium]|nr:prepilin-type N-terminal cleavage/methylation domain-containing protein [Candidatus Gribaldobacteria bacterium]
MQKGFTILELLVVIAIIGILSSVILVSYNGYTDKARIAKTLQWAGSINHSLGDQLVGAWTFDNISTSSNTVYDDSGNSNNGTIYKGGNGTGCDIVDGVVGKAMQFDGVDDYVNAVNSTSLNITDKLTVEMWLYQTGYTGAYSNNPINKGNASTNMTFTLYTGGTSFQRKLYWYANRGGVWGTIASVGNITLNTWTHVVLVYDNGGIQYVNSVRVPGAKVGSGLLASNTMPLRIGGGFYYFNGLIDDVRIFSSALSQAQIQQHYADGLKTHQNLAKQ